MSSNDGAGGAPSTPAAISKPWEMPTLSASTQALLQRLKSAGGLLAPRAPLTMGQAPAPGVPNAETPQYANMRSRVLETMKTSQNMDIDPIPSARRNVKPVGPNTKTGGPRSSASGSRTSTPARATGPNSAAQGSAKKGSAARGRPKAGQKRKRVKDEDMSEEESEAMSELGDDSTDDDTIEFPSMTQSGRKVVKPSQFNPAAQDGPPPAKKKSLPAVHYNKKMPKNIESALCKRCSRGFSPPTNMIVFCDGCNGGWHQQCHQPHVSDAIIKDETSPWFCSECTAKKAARSNRGSAAAATSATASPARAVVSVTADSVALKPMTVEERRNQFSAMSHPHLVAFALYATALHPGLVIPREPSPTSAHQSASSHAQRRTNIHPQQPFPPSATAAAGLFSRAEANPNAPINFIRKIQAGAGSAPSTPFATSFQHGPKNGTVSQAAGQTLSLATSAETQLGSSEPLLRAESAPAAVPSTEDIVMMGTEEFHEDPSSHANGSAIILSAITGEDIEEEESRESTPASPPYPKPGSGLMTKLKSDEDDLEWLVDGEAEEGQGYSHVFVDESGGIGDVRDDIGAAN